MSLPASVAVRLAPFPPALRAFIEAELNAGNAIAEIASCFPAPPAGAYVKFARSVSTRPRASGDGLEFYARNTSLYGGEWTDAHRFYFVLDPPHPAPSTPRADHPLDDRDSAASRPTSETVRTNSQAGAPAASPAPASIVRRFEQSMVIDYEKWHDGIGYDLALLDEAQPDERFAIERLVLRRRPRDWRDIEALAALNTPDATAALQAAFRTGNPTQRLAVLRHAPSVVSPAERTAALLQALRSTGLHSGLSQALDEAAAFHPPAIVDELLRGVLAREPEAAIHFAALLMFIHGLAREPFDWDHRPFFLQFGTSRPRERETRFRDLCARLGVDPARYLGAG